MGLDGALSGRAAAAALSRSPEPVFVSLRKPSAPPLLLEVCPGAAARACAARLPAPAGGGVLVLSGRSDALKAAALLGDCGLASPSLPLLEMLEHVLLMLSLRSCSEVMAHAWRALAAQALKMPQHQLVPMRALNLYLSKRANSWARLSARCGAHFESKCPSSTSHKVGRGVAYESHFECREQTKTLKYYGRANFRVQRECYPLGSRCSCLFDRHACQNCTCRGRITVHTPAPVTAAALRPNPRCRCGVQCLQLGESRHTGNSE